MERHPHLGKYMEKLSDSLSHLMPAGLHVARCEVQDLLLIEIIVKRKFFLGNWKKARHCMVVYMSCERSRLHGGPTVFINEADAKLRFISV